MNRFLTKASAVKEKKNIEAKIKTSVITHGAEAGRALQDETGEDVYVASSGGEEESEEEEKKESGTKSSSSGRGSSRKSSNKSNNVYFRQFKKKTLENQLAFHEQKQFAHLDMLNASPRKYIPVEKKLITIYRSIIPTQEQLKMRDSVI